jgi:hypothetical protein
MLLLLFEPSFDKQLWLVDNSRRFFAPGYRAWRLARAMPWFRSPGVACLFDSQFFEDLRTLNE